MHDSKHALLILKLKYQPNYVPFPIFAVIKVSVKLLLWLCVHSFKYSYASLPFARVLLSIQYWQFNDTAFQTTKRNKNILWHWLSHSRTAICTMTLPVNLATTVYYTKLNMTELIILEYNIYNL